MRRSAKAALGFVLGLALVAGFSQCADAADLEARQSGLWYDPAHDGEGFDLAVYEQGGERRVFVVAYLGATTWNGRPLWATSSAPVREAGAMKLIETGALFGFGSQGIEGTVAGLLSLTVESCDRIRADVDLYGVTAATFNLVPLLPQVGAGC